MSLFFFAVVFFNVILHGVLGLPGIRRRAPIPIIQAVILFVTVTLLWTFFSVLVPLITHGAFGSAFLFPCSVVLIWFFESSIHFITVRVFGKEPPDFRYFYAQTGYGGLVPGALIVTLDTAQNIVDALILAFSFGCGFLLVWFLLNSIRKRAAFEIIPEFWDGIPFFFISLGILSLIFSSLASLLSSVH
ncbi:hypothetical protein PilKf_01152 [Pillotina sp. SPG140]|jgi:Na+-translocating ferredoxin:NAD+ oxidoreductase RnfA subunit